MAFERGNSLPHADASVSLLKYKKYYEPLPPPFASNFQ